MDDEVSSGDSVDVARATEKTKLFDNGEVKSRSLRRSQSSKLGDGVADRHAGQRGAQTTAKATLAHRYSEPTRRPSVRRSRPASDRQAVRWSYFRQPLPSEAGLTAVVVCCQ